MNWTSGFFRLWSVISMVWIALIVGFGMANPSHPATTMFEIESNGQNFTVKAPANTAHEQVAAYLSKNFDRNCGGDKPGPWCNFVATVDMPGTEPRLNWASISIWAVTPPTLLLIFGLSVAWIAVGFRKPR